MQGEKKKPGQGAGMNGARYGRNGAPKRNRCGSRRRDGKGAGTDNYVWMTRGE